MLMLVFSVKSKKKKKQKKKERNKTKLNGKMVSQTYAKILDWHDTFF